MQMPVTLEKIHEEIVGLKKEVERIRTLVEEDESELRTDYVEGAKRIQKEEPIKVDSVGDLRKRYE